MDDGSLTQYVVYTATGLVLIAIGALIIDRQWKKGRRRRSVDAAPFTSPAALARGATTQERRYPGRPPQLDTLDTFHPVLTDDRVGAWDLLNAPQGNLDAIIVRQGSDIAPLSARGAAIARVAFAATPREVRELKRALLEDPDGQPSSPAETPAVIGTRKVSFAGVFEPFRPTALTVGMRELELNDAGSSFFAALVCASGRSLAAAEVLMDLPVGEDR